MIFLFVRLRVSGDGGPSVFYPRSKESVKESNNFSRALYVGSGIWVCILKKKAISTPCIFSGTELTALTRALRTWIIHRQRGTGFLSLDTVHSWDILLWGMSNNCLLYCLMDCQYVSFISWAPVWVPLTGLVWAARRSVSLRSSLTVPSSTRPLLPPCAPGVFVNAGNKWV